MVRSDRSGPGLRVRAWVIEARMPGRWDEAEVILGALVDLGVRDESKWGKYSSSEKSPMCRAGRPLRS